MAKFSSKAAKKLGIKPITKWHTPFMPLDFSLGKGFGEGVWIELFAPEGLGKTTLTLQSASIYLEQNPNSYLLILDVEKALDISMIQKLFYQEDVQVEYESGELYINGEERGQVLMPDTYEQIREITEDFIKFCTTEKIKGLIIWDSLVSAVSESVLKDGKDRIAYKATAIQDYIETYLATFRKVPITLLVINQIRDKVATGFVMGQDKSLGAMIDDTYHVPGGRAHKFYSFQSLMLVSGKKWKYGSSNEKITGRTVKIIPTKNKQAPDRRMVSLVKIDDYGFSNIVSILEFLKDIKLLSGTAAGIKFNEETEIGQLIPKKVNLEKLTDLLITDEKVLDAFYSTAFKALTATYKEFERLQRYEPETQKKIILLDAIKLQKFLNMVNSASIDSFFGNGDESSEEAGE